MQILFNGTELTFGYFAVGRPLYELNIDGICANTPAAKGRIAR
jgi:hypothetical protein